MALSTSQISPTAESPPNGEPRRASEPLDLDQARQSFHSLKQLVSHHGFEFFEDLLGENQELKEAVKRKEQRVTCLQDSHQDHLGQRDKAIETLKKTEADLTQAVDSMKRQIERSTIEQTRMAQAVKAADGRCQDYATDIKHLNAKIASLESEVHKKSKREATLTAELKEAEKFKEESRFFQEQLDEAQKTAEELSSYSIEPYPANDQIIQELASMWDPLIDLVRTYLSIDLPDYLIEAQWLWKRESIVKSKIPLYPENSKKAKRLRACWALKKLCFLAAKRILQPCYAFEHPTELRDILGKMAESDSAMELHIRTRLLAINERHHDFTKEERIVSISDEFLEAVREFVLPEQLGELKSGLIGRLRDLCATWQTIQRLTTRVDFGFDPTGKEVELPFRTIILRQSPTAGNANANPPPLVDLENQGPVILPAIFTVDQDQGITPVIPGACLHKQHIEAGEEERRQLPRELQQRRGSATAKDGVQRRGSVKTEDFSSSKGAKNGPFLESNGGSGGGRSRS